MQRSCIPFALSAVYDLEANLQIMFAAKSAQRVYFKGIRLAYMAVYIISFRIPKTLSSKFMRQLNCFNCNAETLKHYFIPTFVLSKYL